MVIAGIILLACGAAGLIVNVIFWLEAWKHGTMTQRLTHQRRLLVISSLLSVFAGAALTWAGLLQTTPETLGLVATDSWTLF